MAGVDGFAGGQVVGMKNMTRGEIEELQGTGLHYLRTAAGRERKPIVVDEVARDPRFAAGAADAAGRVRSSSFRWCPISA